MRKYIAAVCIGLPLGVIAAAIVTGLIAAVVCSIVWSGNHFGILGLIAGILLWVLVPACIWALAESLTDMDTE